MRMDGVDPGTDAGVIEGFAWVYCFVKVDEGRRGRDVVVPFQDVPPCYYLSIAALWLQEVGAGR